MTESKKKESIKGERFLKLFCNIAFWIFIAGIFFSMFKPFYPLAVTLLVLSIILFLIFSVLFLILKILSSKKKNGT